MTTKFFDFTPVREKRMSLSERVAGLTVGDLAGLTEHMIAAMLEQLRDLVDTDVTFVPEDPDAHDPFAEDEALSDLAWTLGHVIVHTTASAEEKAAIAAELARGVPFHGRSRYEVAWQTVTSLDQCRRRLEESRRMRLASLEMWPEVPHLENIYQPYPSVGELNAVAYFASGLLHDDGHLEQMSKIVRQARAARAG